jgi:hypothetical protein
MKRLIFALVLACVSGAVAYAVYFKTQSANRQFDCEISWLSYKLALTPQQTARVRELHLKYCPTMNGLNAACSRNHDTARNAELAQACRESTTKLVETVSAELTSEQRTIYMKLLAARECSTKQGPEALPK